MVPSRLASSPFRERLDFITDRRGYSQLWSMMVVGDLTKLVLELVDHKGRRLKWFAITKLSSRFKEAEVAESLCDWLLDPR